jgi:hypothetical protein
LLAPVPVDSGEVPLPAMTILFARHFSELSRRLIRG